MGRDMSMPKGLLKQLEVEGGRKSGKNSISVPLRCNALIWENLFKVDQSML